MAETAIYDALPSIQPYLKNCPLAVVKQTMREVCGDFFRETEVWRETLDSFNTVADTDEYTLTLPSGYTALFWRLLEVKLAGKVQNLEDYKLSADGKFVFNTAPTSVKAVILTVVFVPTEANLEIPDWLYSRWSRGLVFGTIATLKEMSDKAWGDPRGAQLWGDRYKQEIARAKNDSMSGRRLGTRIQLRNFF